MTTFHADCATARQFLGEKTIGCELGMSALGQKQTCAVQNVMSALPPKADMCSAMSHVCYVPIADIRGTTKVDWSALVFPCRLRGQFWADGGEVYPTHWQEWSSD